MQRLLRPFSICLKNHAREQMKGLVISASPAFLERGNTNRENSPPPFERSGLFLSRTMSRVPDPAFARMTGLWVYGRQQSPVAFLFPVFCLLSTFSRGG